MNSLLRLVRFYKWAFGDLTVSDSDIGMVGEFVVGEALRCLPQERKAQALYDLVTKDGVTIEVKTTTAVTKRKKGETVRWNIRDQRTALQGKRPLASVWIFLSARFPKSVHRTLRTQAEVFDPKNWTCRITTGEVVRSTGCLEQLSATTLDKFGVKILPCSELTRRSLCI